MKRTLVLLVLPLCSVMAIEPNYTLPPITYMTPESTMQWARDRGHRLMSLKGIPDGDVTLVCTNWACPTSIVVNAVGYAIVTNWWNDMLEFDVMTTNDTAVKVAGGEISIQTSGREAREEAFADMSCTSMPMSQYALGVVVQPIDPATNMMFLTSIGGGAQSWRRLIYKNIGVRYSVTSMAIGSPATNALAFTAAIINAGLPEAERIPLPPAP